LESALSLDKIDTATSGAALEFGAMKATILSLLALAALLVTSCSVNAHANKHSTGAGASAGRVGASGSLSY
jgi:hypothetical protein